MTTASDNKIALIALLVVLVEDEILRAFDQTRLFVDASEVNVVAQGRLAVGIGVVAVVQFRAVEIDRFRLRNDGLFGRRFGCRRRSATYAGTSFDIGENVARLQFGVENQRLRALQFSSFSAAARKIRSVARLSGIGV